MKQHHAMRRISLILALVMVLGLFPTVWAQEPGVVWQKSEITVSQDLSHRTAGEELEGELRRPTDTVRVSIVLEEKPTVQAGFATLGIGQNDRAMAYDAALLARQQELARVISREALGGAELDVVWNLTLVGNAISANVPYGSMEAIAQVEGVLTVVEEQCYTPSTAESSVEPMTHGSGEMTGAFTAWTEGYTGAGSRVAIIDTGTDTDHQSFDNGAYLYALSQNAMEAGMSQEEYLSGLNLLDTAELAGVLDRLNVSERSSVTAGELYINEKLPFGYNYVDGDLDVTHDGDGQGEHGSHVAGIAAANRLIPAEKGYTDAVAAVHAAGVAPDAQIITMKVFGKLGGAYESDYMAAIEDAILLGADAVNLSLGSAAPGSAYNDVYSGFLEYLETTDTVVVMSAGNSGNWADNAWSGGYLYNDGVNFDTVGMPGSYTNALTVASVNNIGSVGNYFAVGGERVVYTEYAAFGNSPMTGLDLSADGSGTDYPFVYLNGLGLEEEYEGLDVTGKVVFIPRGSISFADKANAAAARGAAAVVICNSEEATMYLDLTGYGYSIPVVSIRLSQAEAVLASAQPGERCATGTVTVCAAPCAMVDEPESYTMSSFSSWGVPGNLSMKPEITAPGGNIWSVWGSTPAGGGSDQYELMSGTSMAAPQVTGMTAVLAQHLREKGLEMQGGNARQLAQSLLMSTAEPMRDAQGNYHSILSQGAGLGRVDLAVKADSYILVDGQSDGKVKAELGDDPDRKGEYRVAFTVNDLTGTGSEYTLAAEVFVQAVFEENGVLYLDKATAMLPTNIRFTSEGARICDTEVDCDLNGDGCTDALDADHLLEYLLGNETQLHAEGDVDGDGKVDSYDAHALLSALEAKNSITVPRGGSVPVEAVLTLTEEARELLAERYPDGTYIQAYIHVRDLGDGVSHSIPVLGYYGSWTDASMFDIGSYAEFQSGSETRTPYLYGLGYGLSGENRVNGDYLTIDYGDGEELYWGGNPITAEAEYRPERNAMNNANGARLRRFGDTLIRSAAETRLVMTNLTTGEIYRDELMGAMTGAYYHPSEGAWFDYRYRTNLNWSGTDLEGNPLPEGTTVELSFIAAPEYYRVEHSDGSYTIDWDALGEGAYDTTLITIDNTAPVIEAMELNRDNGDVLTVTALDNRFVAAVALYNARGTAMLAAAPANQDRLNEEVTIEMDLSGVFGDEFLVVVYDYAMNATVYEARLELRGQRPYYTILETPYGSAEYLWKGTEGEEGAAQTTLGRLNATSTPGAVEYVDGFVFTVTGVFDDFKLQISRDDDLEVFYEAELDPTGARMLMGVTDMAFNPADGRLYALAYQIDNFWMAPYLSVIDMELGTIKCLGELPMDFDSLACDGEGNFYAFVSYSTIGHGGELYTFRVDSYAEPELVGSASPYASSLMSCGNLTWDDLTGKLAWIVFYNDVHYLLEVDPATAETKVLRTLPNYTAGLYVRTEATGEFFRPTDRVSSIQLPAAASTLVRNQITLNAVVGPWTVSDQRVTWKSSDERIAVVDENGVVTGIGVGTAVITATSVLDSSVSASCTVTVEALDTDLQGIVWNDAGEVWWSEFNTDTLPAYQKQSQASEPFVSAVRLPEGGMYAATLDRNSSSRLFRVEEDSWSAVEIGGTDVAYFDLAWAPNLTESGLLLAVYGPYVLVVDPATGGYVGAFKWSEDADLVGITYCETVMNNTYYELVDYFYLIDADGRVYKEGFMDIGGVYYYYDGPVRGYKTTFGHSVESAGYHSAYYDPTGNYLYWSAYSEINDRSELLACNMTNGRVYVAGTFEEGTWPVGGLMAPAAASAAEVKTMEAQATPMELTEVPAPAAAGGLNSTDPEQDTKTHPAETAAVTVTVPMDSTNGITGVRYDAAELEVVYVSGLTAAFAWKQEEGVLTIAYAAADALKAGEGNAVVTFRPVGTADSAEVTLEYGECNRTVLDRSVVIPVELVRDCPSAAFTDLESDKWYHEAVDFVLDEGLMNGMGGSTFAPGGVMNRAQLVTILYRLAGSPAVEDCAPFEDVPAGQWCTAAVIWARDNGITTGYSDTRFAPEEPVVREQMVTFLARYYALQEVQIEGADLSGYTDADRISGYARPAFRWAVENGIVQGVGADALDPHGTAIRAQIAAILMRCCERFGS